MSAAVVIEIHLRRKTLTTWETIRVHHVLALYQTGTLILHKRHHSSFTNEYLLTAWKLSLIYKNCMSLWCWIAGYMIWMNCWMFKIILEPSSYWSSISRTKELQGCLVYQEPEQEEKFLLKKVWCQQNTNEENVLTIMIMIYFHSWTNWVFKTFQKCMCLYNGDINDFPQHAKKWLKTTGMWGSKLPNVILC